ncbi:MAG: hypothetical protein ACI915_003782 [Gammaproteobacteria bacterium]|jgi:hypothetical protein
MKLVPLLTYYAHLSEVISVGTGAYGNRLIVEVDGGKFEGPRLKGTLRRAGCADWATMAEDYVHLDVRGTFETHDGAFIYVEYYGRLELTPAVQAALGGEGSTEFEESYFVTTPRMQTGDPRYQWVNNIMCVARGKLSPGRVDYEVFEVKHD